MLRPPPSSTLFPYTTLFRSDLLRGRRAEELPPGRGVVEEFADLDRRSDRATGRNDRRDTAPFARDRRPRVGRRDAARDRKPRDRGDGGERLAPESEGADRAEPVPAVELARRVPLERERELLGKDPDP